MKSLQERRANLARYVETLVKHITDMDAEIAYMQGLEEAAQNLRQEVDMAQQDLDLYRQQAARQLVQSNLELTVDSPEPVAESTNRGSWTYKSDPYSKLTEPPEVAQ